jgi:hypothetical protein
MNTGAARNPSRYRVTVTLRRPADRLRGRRLAGR